VKDPSNGHDLSFFASFFRIAASKNEDGSLSVMQAFMQHICAPRRRKRAANEGRDNRLRQACIRILCASQASSPELILLFCCLFLLVFLSSNHAHALNWAIVDVTAKTYHADPILDRETPAILRRQLRDGSYDLDSRMARAFLEVVEKGAVPLPDRMFDGPVTVSKTKLDLNYDGNTFRSDAEGNYHLHCECAAKGINFTFKLQPQKQPMRQAHDGIVKIGLKQDVSAALNFDSRADFFCFCVCF
jgi:hypothetical protein